MAKFKEILLELNKTLNNNEISALAGASAIQDLEVGDETLTEVSTKMSGLFSLDAAKNNHDLEDHFKKKLHPTIKGELLGNLDTDLISTAKTLFGEESVSKFKDVEFTGDKIKLFGDLTKDKLAKGGNDDELKKLNGDLKQQITDLASNQQKELKKKEKEINDIKNGFTDKLIKKEFNSLLSTYNLGEKYQEDFVKKALHNEIYTKVQEKAKLTLSETGSILPRNPQNPEMELFIDNNPVTDLKPLLDPIMQPYVKANNKGETSKGTYTPVAEDTNLSRQAKDLIARRNETNEF